MRGPRRDTSRPEDYLFVVDATVGICKITLEEDRRSDLTKRIDADSIGPWTGSISRTAGLWKTNNNQISQFRQRQELRTSNEPCIRRVSNEQQLEPRT